MDYKKGISSYQDIQFQTADPAKLILLMFEKLDEELHNVKEYIQLKKIELKGNSILKSQDIIFELMNSLNFDAGKIAKNLQALYLFLFKELNVINFDNDIKKLDQVLKIIENLKSAWEEIIHNPPPDNQVTKYQESNKENFAIVG